MSMIGTGTVASTFSKAAMAWVFVATVATPSFAAHHSHRGPACHDHYGQANDAAPGYAKGATAEDPNPSFQRLAPNECWEDEGLGRRTSCEAF